MINKDSIVTAYDEHLTLVEWLQKVETALNNAVLTNLGIAKLSDQGNIATYRVTATFADNTTIVSDTFTLPSTDIVTAFNNLTALVNGFEARLGRALLTPLLAPSTRKVVTIDTNGAQDNVDGTELTTLMSNIVDSHGNKRFAEGNITMTTIEGVTQTYGKWSLSGTHLMIVIAGNIEGSTTIAANTELADISFPSYIANKLVPIYGTILDKKAFSIYGNTGLILTSFETYCQKVSTHAKLVNRVEITSPAGGYFRIQYDFLIDNE